VVKRLARLQEESGLQIVDITNRKDVVRQIAFTLAELASQNNLEIQSCAEFGQEKS